MTMRRMRTIEKRMNLWDEWNQYSYSMCLPVLDISQSGGGWAMYSLNPGEGLGGNELVAVKNAGLIASNSTTDGSCE